MNPINPVSTKSGAVQIFVGAGSTLTGNTAYGNGNTGLRVICPSVVIGNTANNNLNNNLDTTGPGCKTKDNVN